MGEVKFIRTPEKRDIIKELNEKFGITEIPFLLVDWGREKIRAFSGSLSKDEIISLSRAARIDGLGIYFLKREETGLRPSIEALQLLKNQITKNILDIDEKNMNLWMRGHDLDIKIAPGIYAIRFEGDFLGCGKSNGNSIFNYVPKERRLKKQ
jgi:NOL1/NOP2/fmu family ribosome biogenesis protein